MVLKLVATVSAFLTVGFFLSMLIFREHFGGQAFSFSNLDFQRSSKVKGNRSTDVNVWLDRAEERIISMIREFPSDSILLSVNRAIKEKKNSASQIQMTFDANQ